jgi:putative ABC transport system permease protein
MILVLLSLAAGTSSQTGGLLRNIVGAEITVVNSTTPTFPGGNGGPPGGGTGGFGGGGGGFASFFGSGNTLNESLVSTIDGITGVYGASPQLTTTGYVNGNTVFLYGIDPDTYSNVTTALDISSGSTLSPSSVNYPIVLSDTLATNLGLSVGSSVTVGKNSTGGTTYTVVGTYDPGSSFGPQSRSAYIPLSDAQSISNESDKVTEIFVKAENPDLVSTVSTEISSKVPGVTANAPAALTTTASTLSDTLSSFFTVIGLVALMAGGFGVINTMLMSITERTREIGTLRAIGAKKGDVLRIFMSEAFLIGLIGAGVGVLIGVVVAIALPALTGHTAATGGGFAGAGASLLRGGLNTALTLDNLLISLGLGALVGTVAGIYPAWRASNMDPVEALRHA